MFHDDDNDLIVKREREREGRKGMRERKGRNKDEKGNKG